MEYVKKNSPTKPAGFVSPSVKSRLLVRDEYSNEIVSLFLKEAHEVGHWLICDCRDDVSFESMPGMSVVRRSGHYHLRNLPSREEHKAGCPFSYFKSTPWVQDEAVTECYAKPGVVQFSSSWLEVNPAYLFFRMLEGSGWTGYSTEFNFLELIFSLQKTATDCSVGGHPVSDLLTQSPSSLTESLARTRKIGQRPVSVFICHKYKRNNLQFLRDDDVQLTFESGVMPVYGVSAETTGPYLVMSVFGAASNPEFGSYIPVAAKNKPIPVLNEKERVVALTLFGYLDWLSQTAAFEVWSYLTITKRVEPSVRFLPGFEVTNDFGHIIVDVDFHNIEETPYYDKQSNTIYIPSDCTEDNKGWPNKLKRLLREHLMTKKDEAKAVI